ncbi:TPA: hypothetical protein ACWLW2_000660 [Morganella morganii]
MASSLRKYFDKNIVSTARTMFTGAGKKKTIIVEGVNDCRFFNQWFGDNNNIRFVAVNGKDNVIHTYNDFLNNQMMVEKKAMFFCVDVDWDFIHGKIGYSKDFFILNSACLFKQKHLYNDLEIFLINTVALKKVLSSYDINIESDNLLKLKRKLELASRIIGKYRAADDVTKKRLFLSKSILNGLDAMSFFDPENMEVDEDNLIKSMSGWSNYPIHIDDLIEDAEVLNSKYTLPWSLSNGHDVTEMLAKHICSIKGWAELKKEKIEAELRISCELADFSTTPMYEKFLVEGLI